VSAALHVTNGGSVAGTLRATSLGGETLPWNDVLHEGPVPDVPRDLLLGVRAAFLSQCGRRSETEILSDLKRRDRRYLDALQDGTQVVLWFEHDLFDQLQLIDALALAGEVGVLPDLILVSSFPGKPSFAGLGELDPDELETLWPRRAATSAETVAVARTAWEAFRAADPVALGALVDDDAEPELLVAALARLLEELPSATDGLSGTERRALEALATGAVTAGQAFAAAQDAEPAPFLGDTWFYRTLAELGRGPTRLAETAAGADLAAPTPEGGPDLWQVPLRLTDTGRAVLRGEADRVELLGLDRWLGGTHLTAENAWRWDSGGRQLVAPV
jgi:hypothetical protein